MSDPALEVIREAEATHRRGFRWRMSGITGEAQRDAIDAGWLVPLGDDRLVLAEHEYRFATAIVDETIIFWIDSGVTPTEAWIALGQRRPSDPRYWPEVRAVMLRWLTRETAPPCGNTL